MKKGDANDRMLTPPEIGRLLAVDPAKILVWIRNGELVACDVATRRGGRPRFRVAPAELQAFLLRRQSAVAPAPRQRRRRPLEVVDFFS